MASWARQVRESCLGEDGLGQHQRSEDTLPSEEVGPAQWHLQLLHRVSLWGQGTLCLREKGPGLALGPPALLHEMLGGP